MSLDIQRILEESIPEVEDLVERGLLSKDEVGAVISKRREMETRIHRFEVVKTDYLQYVEYELNLGKLIEKRKQRLNVKRKGLGDNASTKRIHFIFERALRKFQGDVDLWIAAIDFAQAKESVSRISKLLAQAIKLFPQREGFWILAAAHEFECNKNVAEARAVMMQAIRVNPKSETIWLEYFKLEFLFLHQVLGRRTILGLETGDEEPIVRGDILKIVYRKATEALSNSCKFRLDFVRVSELFLGDVTRSTSELIIAYVLDDVVSSFADTEPIVWIEQAKRAATDTEADKLLKHACKSHGSPQLWQLVIARAKEQQDTDKVKSLCEEALALEMLSETSAVMWAEVVSAAPEVTRKKTRRSVKPDDRTNNDSLLAMLSALNTRFPKCAQLWKLRCEHDCLASAKAVEAVSPSESVPFWQLEIERDESKLRTALVKLSQFPDCSDAVETLVNQTLDKAKAPSAVVVHLERTAINCVSLRSFMHTFARPNLDYAEKVKLLNLCVERFPHSMEAWKAYIALETETRNAKRVHEITLRAMANVPELKASMSTLAALT